MMVKKYLLTTLRNFVRNRSYTLINMTGLSVGITSCVIIFLLISHELSFDKFHGNFDRIYRVVMESQSASGTEYGTTTPYPFTDAFRNDFADVPVTQMHMDYEGFVKVGAEKNQVDNVLFADSMFFQVFDFKVLRGNPSVELGRPGRVFLTESLAERLLKDNETHLRLNNKVDLEVAGIVADPPDNSHITFDMVVSMPTLTGEYLDLPIDSWSMTMSGFNYVLLPGQIEETDLEDRLVAFAGKYLDKDESDRKKFWLQPLSAIHFDERYTENPGPANASEKNLMAMGVLGLFILAIACVNFINLATALAVNRSKEIGVRKTLGAMRGQLTAYFLGETFILTVFSVIISLGLVEWLLRWLNPFLDLHLSLDILSNPALLLFLGVLIVLTTLLAGFYPAVMLSSYNPLAVLKNRITSSTGGSGSVRKVLVVFQFMIAQVLIISTLIMAGQMNYFRDKPLGFEKDFIVTVPLFENNLSLLESLKTRLENQAGISKVSFSLGAPTSDNQFSTGFFLSEKGSDERFRVFIKPVDRDYLETYGLHMKAGRWFTEAEEKAAMAENDARYVYIVNEAAARKLGFSSPEEIIGKQVTTGINSIEAEVIGVVEDFHTRSLHETIEPVIMLNMPLFYYEAGIRIAPGSSTESLAHIRAQWSDVFPEYNFQFEFLDQHLATLYERDDRTFTLFKVFAGISIFIGCLGLYGLISFVASQKLKEVSIRKVLGASTTNIMVLFSREFVLLITIAFAVAAPLSAFFMKRWLSDFAYRIHIPWNVFVIGILSTMAIALLTVSYKSLRAALTNPAETLRSE